MQTIFFAAGCFWGAQKFFDQFEGVVSTETGYANGLTENPSYEDVRYRGAGHAETVKVVFDETKLSLKALLDGYFLVIDPLSVNKQGEDEDTQYRTGIYYEDDSLLPVIGEKVRAVEKTLGQPLAVEVLPLRNFYTAEEYHQKYLDKHPEGYCHIPKALLHMKKKA